MMTEDRTAVEMTAQEQAEYEAYKAEKQKKQAAQQRKDEREAYRQMVNEEVLRAIPELIVLSEQLAEAKKKVFEAFTTILALKAKVMKRTKNDQNSHTFTDAEGRYKLVLGAYQTDAYDSTVEDGIAMVKEYIASLAGDDKKVKSLVSMVMQLLAKDATGTLKASRILQLRKLAVESGDEGFIEGVRIIEESWSPEASSSFLRAMKRGANGKWVPIPLGMTEA
jgi:hypothetical protein